MDRESGREIEKYDKEGDIEIVIKSARAKKYISQLVSPTSQSISNSVSQPVIE